MAEKAETKSSDEIYVGAEIEGQQVEYRVDAKAGQIVLRDGRNLTDAFPDVALGVAGAMGLVNKYYAAVLEAERAKLGARVMRLSNEKAGLEERLSGQSVTPSAAGEKLTAEGHEPDAAGLPDKLSGTQQDDELAPQSQFSYAAKRAIFGTDYVIVKRPNGEIVGKYVAGKGALGQIVVLDAGTFNYATLPQDVNADAIIAAYSGMKQPYIKARGTAAALQPAAMPAPPPPPRSPTKIITPPSQPAPKADARQMFGFDAKLRPPSSESNDGLAKEPAAPQPPRLARDEEAVAAPDEEDAVGPAPAPPSAASEENSSKEPEEFECPDCGAAVGAADARCKKCGAEFE